VPNYRLEECHNADAAFQTASTLSLRTALQALRYALWDSDLERLVPFASPPPLNRCPKHISQH
jgi:omega-6 fatty acid desaturase (delta-12 desaturase)